MLLQQQQQTKQLKVSAESAPGDEGWLATTRVEILTRSLHALETRSMSSVRPHKLYDRICRNHANTNKIKPSAATVLGLPTCEEARRDPDARSRARFSTLEHASVHMLRLHTWICRNLRRADEAPREPDAGSLRRPAGRCNGAGALGLPPDRCAAIRGLPIARAPACAAMIDLPPTSTRAAP